MAKLIKDNSVQNIITDGDVIITSPSKIGKTLDEVLDEQQADIDRLKSNIKYIYAYGGVGGTGAGGSGSTEKPTSILITLNGIAVNGGDTIILDGKGVYKLYIKVSNAGGRNLYVGYAVNSTVPDKLNMILNGDNKYKREIDVNLDVNGELNIRIEDDEGNIVGYYNQKYIVDSDMFNVTLNYEDENGDIRVLSEPHECFVNDPNRKNRHFKIDYSIFLTDYTDVNVNFEIEGAVIKKYEERGTSIIIPIEYENSGIFIGDDPILQNKYMGSYTLKATLTYIIAGKEVVRTRSLLFTIVPSGLYINVRTSGDVLYDSVESLMADIPNGIGGIPNKYITTGSSLMLYCKVFEGDIIGPDRLVYPTTFKVYDAKTYGEGSDSEDSDSEDNTIFDENGEIQWDEIDVDISDDLREQVESKNGVSITFSKKGIKKIVITTTSQKGDTATTSVSFEKYVYVKEFSSVINWYNSDRYGVLVDSYFRANQGDHTYGGYFPKLSSGEGVFGLTISSNPEKLTDSTWYTNISGNVSTIISFGIQVSNINSEDAKIAEVYQQGLNVPKFTLRTTRLFTDANSNINKIAIPTETFDKNDNTKYHLIQIVRSYNGSEFEDSLYIDGLLESVDRNISGSALVISKIILNNINIYYNLINIQYAEDIFTTESGDKVKFNPDAFAYQYWLSYKEKYVKSSSNGVRITDAENFIRQNMHRIFFDGVNVEVDEGIISDIAQRSQLPTVVFEYECANEEDISSFMNMMWAGRPNGDETFGNKQIKLYWIPAGGGGTVRENEVKIPETLKTYKNEDINGQWSLNLQGTSTMRNRIKNYSLKISTNTDREKILFSPNFNVDDTKTFLPDVEWTIKADIADSAHANNTSIGKFVNEVCTKFETNIPYTSDYSKQFVKNTLEGIPVLLYFMCSKKKENEESYDTKTYYFGIYNFNLGRTSYYNLGYTGGIVDDKVSDFGRVFDNITNGVPSKYSQGDVFSFAVGEVALSNDIIVGEIQDNFPEFDFHQYHESVLFKSSNDDNIATMFGSDSKITAVDKTAAKSALQTLVKGVAKAGKYCFIRSGREGDLITSREGDLCVNRYEEGLIPDPIYQMRYVNNKLVWSDTEDDLCKKVNENDLKELITVFRKSDGTVNKPILNYNSASEYYTICMAFGMVDSVLKNMNLKCFTGATEPCFHCSFYDMDCALEEDNSGKETVSYLAATDYWYSPVDPVTKKVKPVEKKNDYWDRVNGGQGFDFTSSYLLAVIKYAKPIFNAFVSTDDIEGDDLQNYPQRFWASLRRDGGELQNADYFINKYFNSGVMSTFEYLASLNYRVKYLYKGETLDSNNHIIVQPLANASAFNGSRRIKVKNWLTKRLRFMDVMFNVNRLNIPISDNDTITVPSPPESFVTLLINNPDITILHSAFDDGNLTGALNSYTGEIEIYAPKHTPFIHLTGTDKSTLYLLPGSAVDPNLLSLSVYATIASRFYGSGMFTSVNKVETMFTDYGSIVSDNIEKITYGGTAVSPYSDGFIINAKSATEISLNIPNMGGLLDINDNCISLSKINISNSGFYGEFNKFPNLQEVNISSVHAETNGIAIGGSKFLKGENVIVSGKDEEHKTKLSSLQITGVTGRFNFSNTDIQTISIVNSIREGVDSNELSEFSIYGDRTLTNLTLNGFRKVSITSCNNLEILSIDNALEELYINLEKNDKDERTSKLNKIFLSNLNGNKDDYGYIDEIKDNEGNVIYNKFDGTGIFDFTNYPNLKKVTLKNCDKLVRVKLPDNRDENGNSIDIETEGMSGNPELRWIDTGNIPAFLYDDNDHNKDGYIEGKGEGYEGVRFPIYSKGSKLILCSEGAFQNCPNYNMLRSDWNKGSDMLGENYRYNIAYTNITVSEKCTSLANTFNTSVSSNNLLGDCEFNMDAAIRFIEICVPDNVKQNITSLSGCFRGRKGIMYTIGDAASDKGYNVYSPKLSKYTSLNNISRMYENTGVEFISKELLSLPYDVNNIGNNLSWGSFISRMYVGVNISKDALENISYRLETYSSIKFNIFEYDDNSNQYRLANNLDICEFFYHIENDGVILPYNHITSIDSLNFGYQIIDFRGMFNLFPNVKTISNFLNGKLDLYKMDGLLKPCENITSIDNSFCDDDVDNMDITKPQIIDLYEFFNWEHNTTDITNLFEGQVSNNFTNGFRVKKTITYENFNKVLSKITEYTKLTRLTNIFSYCTITGYQDVNDEDREIKFEKPLNNIKNISFLFENCTSDYKPLANVRPNDSDRGIYKGGVLKIGRSFFENLPNFTIAQRTFANTYLSSSLTYDYFCKRNKEYDEETTIYLSENKSDVAKLYERGYNSSIINLKECFYNTKFVNCKNWFDHDSDINKNIIGNRNYIEKDGDEKSDRGLVYYIYNEFSESFERYMLDNDIFDDCLDNYTDFISYNEIHPYKWYNHDLYQDFSYYGNIKDKNIPFNFRNESDNTIQKTYCCLPPDLLYGCSSTATIDSIFANSNIIGVIPRNLTKKIKNKSIPNIFKNVNIMPNLEYYYDKNGGLDSSILNEVAIDDDLIGDESEYKVVFRDEYGRLKKRKPVDSDRNLGQFVYVPANFTTNSSLMDTFNFRYNLPKHWNLPTELNAGVSGYKTTREFNEAKLDLDYHTQYFFTTDESVKWESLRDVRSVFISDEQDIDFSNKNTIGKSRVYCDKRGEVNSWEMNAWSTLVNGHPDISTSSQWVSSNVVDKFYIDLNLCGKKNIYKIIEDFGCPINIRNREVYLDNFISGILTIFLNGRVFDDEFAINDLTSANHKNSGGSYVIGYYGFGKNIILPKYNGTPLDKKFNFIPTNSKDIIYYDFMIYDNDEQSINYYRTNFDERMNINTDKNKYTFKPQ